VSFLELTSSLDELCLEAEWFLLVGVSISKGIGSKCKMLDIINSCYINFVIKIRHLIDISL
jgi:predicted histidine transporter YuiF (NhaC family)